MTIKEMVESYAKSYEGMLPPEAIERAKTFWRDELTKAYTLGQKEGYERGRADEWHRHVDDYGNGNIRHTTLTSTDNK